MILDLLKTDGFEPKRKTATEYSSPCPACGGRDRFVIWPDANKWWCRQCGGAGDNIDYLRDFHGLTFQEAADQVGKVIPDRGPARQRKRITRLKPAPPTGTWLDKAGSLVDFAHSELQANNDRLDWLLTERGLNLETVKRFQLGWLGKDYFPLRKDWGLPDKEVDGRVIKKLLVPSGLIIPCLDKEKVTRVRIRRDRPGKMGKYYIISGCSMVPMVCEALDAKANPAIIVESELDAILLAQEIRNPLTIIAMGSAQMKPNEKLATELKAVPFIFICLDSDSAGAKQTHYYWLETFNNAVRVPVPRKYGKDITAAYLNGLDLNLLAEIGYEFVIELGGKGGKLGAGCPSSGWR